MIGPGPLPIEQVQETTSRLLAGTSYNLILTHGPKGEYTRHRRHQECCQAVVELWRSGGIGTGRLWLFAYEDGGRAYTGGARKQSDASPSLAHAPANRGASNQTPLFLFGLALYRKSANQPEFLNETAQKASKWMQYQSPDDRVMVCQLPTSYWRDEQ